MSKPEGADNCIEHAVGKWEVFYFSFTKINAGMQSLRQQDYCGDKSIPTGRAPYFSRCEIFEMQQSRLAPIGFRYEELGASPLQYA
jgi:hypothetical protein